MPTLDRFPWWALFFADRMTIFPPVDIEVIPRIGGKLNDESAKRTNTNNALTRHWLY
mgnify:CR=1 FL=1